MENENTYTQTNDQQKAPAVGGDRGTSFAEAIFGSSIRESVQETNETDQEGGAASPDVTATGLLDFSDAGAETEGDTQPGEESEQLEDVWQFGGVEYTAAQVEESLRERDMYQRFNQNVQPLADALQASESELARYKEMALTETEKQMEHVKSLIANGQLDPRQRAKAYDDLEDLKSKKRRLLDAAEQSAKAQQVAMERVRHQRTNQTVNALTRQGWKEAEISTVGGALKQVFGDKLGDVISPQLMQVFRDAAELRGLKEGAAKRLNSRVKDATSSLRTVKQGSAKTDIPAQPAKEKSFGSMIFGGE